MKYINILLDPAKAPTIAWMRGALPPMSLPMEQVCINRTSVGNPAIDPPPFRLKPCSWPHCRQKILKYLLLKGQKNLAPSVPKNLYSIVSCFIAFCSLLVQLRIFLAKSEYRDLKSWFYTSKKNWKFWNIRIQKRFHPR